MTVLGIVVVVHAVHVGELVMVFEAAVVAVCAVYGYPW